MIKRYLAIGIVLTVAVPAAYDQRRSKRVKQPREVLEAYKVCTEFRSLVAEDFDFDRAFEATFVKDPARRREIAISDGGFAGGDLSPVDTDTLVEIYKGRTQLFILMLPLMFAGGEEVHAELFPPPIATIFERKPPTDPHQLKAYAAQLRRDVTDFRAHVENLARNNPDVAKNIRTVEDSLRAPVELPNRVVKPLTAYSRGRVLPPKAKYYQIDDCAVIREGAQMKLVGYVFLKFRG